jgi:hypothetical protein
VKLFSIAFISISLFSSALLANNLPVEIYPPLDPAYKDLVHPHDDAEFFKSSGRSDVETVIDFQTSVKSQGYRGTCSMFSGIALLESMLRIRGLADESIDLSEQYLEYLTVRGKTTDGSNSYTNFNAIARYGVPYESTLPYVSVDWVTKPELAKDRCGHLSETSTAYKSCLVIHWDPSLLFKSDEELMDSESVLFAPEFVAARAEAASNRDSFIRLRNRNYSLYNVSSIKSYLDANIPMTMGITIYYGAWNHGAGRAHGIEMNTDNWYKGIVSYPEVGSFDYEASKKAPAGHSVVIVGYDDSKVITETVKMANGTEKEFSYTGVYYFKNSWGTTSFGRDFELDGQSLPGYGMISQKYAHQYGSFYQLPL